MTLAEAIQELEKKKTFDNKMKVVNILKKEYKKSVCNCVSTLSLIEYAKRFL